MVDVTPTSPPPRRRWLVRLLVGAIVLVALGIGAFFIWVNFVKDSPDEFTTDDLAEALTETTPAPTSAPPAGTTGGSAAVTTPPPAATTPASAPAGDGVDGTWVATEASELGYRVKEILFGVDTEGVGRTNQIEGSLTIAGTQVTDAEFTVDVASIESDDSRRDNQFRGRIMSVDEFPTATFVLTEPIELGAVPGEGEQISASATGELTLRGVTNPVTFDVTAQREAGRIGVLGSIPVVFADYQIANPSTSGITTEDEGLLEFVLVFER